MTANLAIGLFASVLCIGDSLVLDSRAQGAETPQRIRIAYASRSSSAMPQYVAQTKGFFKLEGLETELIQMNPRLGATAVVNGDVSFATPFVSIFRGILQGFPIKLVFVHLKKGPYYVMVRPEIKDVQQLKSKKLGVATIKGADQLVAEELLQAKGFNPSLIQAVAIGDGPVRMQALISGAVEAICVAPPHDLLLKRMGYPALAGPPEVGLPCGRDVYLGSSLARKSAIGQADAQNHAQVAPVYFWQQAGIDPNIAQMAATAAGDCRTLV